MSTIQRLLKRHQLTTQPPKPCPQAYRPHPLTTYPNAVHATDIIARWITGGDVVQTFNTVDIYSHDVYSSSHAAKTVASACAHLPQPWQQLGVPDVAQFDNESAFSGGNHPWVLGQVMRLCLYLGIEVLGAAYLSRLVPQPVHRPPPARYTRAHGWELDGTRLPHTMPRTYRCACRSVRTVSMPYAASRKRAEVSVLNHPFFQIRMDVSIKVFPRDFG